MLEKADFLEGERPERLIVFDIPLLYESKLTHWVKKVIVVYVPESVQIRRLMDREGIGEEGCPPHDPGADTDRREEKDGGLPHRQFRITGGNGKTG